MVRRISRSLEMLNFVLVPESSFNQVSSPVAPLRTAISKMTVRGYFKTAFWIVLAITMSLIIGQLH